MAKLQLAVKREYFIAIRDGRKSEEYRRANAFWVKRLFQPDGQPQQFDCVVITEGYPKSDDHDRILTFEWRGFTRKTITHPHFGPEPVEVYAIDVSHPSPQPNVAGSLWDQLVVLSGYHITRPPTPDHEFVQVCNGDLRKMVELMDRTEQHPDDLAVDRFAAAMKAKLAKKRDEGRGGWEDKEHCSNAFLSRLLVEHVQKGDPVDVGNLAMMIHQRGEGIGVAAGNASAIAQLNAIVDAWEALPGGRQVNNSDVARWLAKNMGPGIDAIRGFLRRPRPDGILPPSPQPREVGP